MSLNASNQNRGNIKKFNFTKWSFILGIPVAIAATITTAVTVPEVRCSIGLKSEACVVQKQEVQLVIQTEAGESLEGVKVQVISQGAPEVQSTDNHGFAKVIIPSVGDVLVNLSKAGYPTQNIRINLKNDQSTTRIIRLTQSGKPEVKSQASSSQITSVPSPSTTTLPAETTPTIPVGNTDLSSTNSASILLQTECESATAGNSLNGIIRRPSNKSVTLGREVLPLLADIHSPTSSRGIGKSPVEFVCNLKSDFKQMKLVFGVHRGNYYAHRENKLLFEVFLDDKSAGKREVTLGSKQEWILSLDNIKNVSLRVECATNSCPTLSFTEMSLQ